MSTKTRRARRKVKIDTPLCIFLLLLVTGGIKFTHLAVYESLTLRRCCHGIIMFSSAVLCHVLERFGEDFLTKHLHYITCLSKKIIVFFPTSAAASNQLVSITHRITTKIPLQLKYCYNYLPLCNSVICTSV